MKALKFRSLGQHGHLLEPFAHRLSKETSGAGLFIEMERNKLCFSGEIRLISMLRANAYLMSTVLVCAGSILELLVINKSRESCTSGIYSLVNCSAILLYHLFLHAE